jgi:hypothetical protein
MGSLSCVKVREKKKIKNAYCLSQNQPDINEVYLMVNHFLAPEADCFDEAGVGEMPLGETR